MAARYPLCKVRLKIRIEDFEIDAPPPDLIPLPGDIEGFGAGAEGEVIAENPYVRTLDLQPLTCSIELNSPRKADTAKVSFLRKLFPVDAQIIRSATLQVFFGVVSSEEYADACGPVNAPGLVLPDVVPEGRPFAGESNEVFRGFVDLWETDQGEDGDTVEITARDTTGFFIDAEISENPLTGIPSSMTIDKVIEAMISGDGLPAGISKRGGLPGARGTAVVVETSRPPPALKDIKPPTWFTAKRTATKTPKKAPKQKDMKFWDFVTDLCVAAGLKARMRSPRKPKELPGLGYVLPAAEIVICDAQTYYAGITTVERSFIVGHNCKTVKTRRVLGGTPTPTVEVRSYDWESDKQIIGRYPPASKSRTNKPTATGKGDKEEIVVYELDELTGPNAEERATEAARHIFDQLARGEFEITIRTTATNANPDNDDDELAPDMLYLRPGDTISVLTDPMRDALGLKLGEDGKPVTVSPDEFVQILVENGFDHVTAVLIANASADPRRQKEFFTQTVSINWDPKQGFSFDVQAINYLDVRNAVN